jgi:eukaryotic-like serine/threonine-protein kinase
MATEGTPDAPPTAFGRYQLLDRLAIGGMAEVFRAKISSSHGFEKILVIKRILPHLAADPSFVAMFIDEAKLTAQLTHPKIVQVLDFGEVQGQFFTALEFIDGFDALGLLRTAAQKRVRLPRALAVFIISEVLEALDYAHNARDVEGKPMQIVHRDISPSNVFISKRGDVKLGDFGIAHAERRESKTQAGTLKGKYGYMSPEQVVGKSIDARSDLFAVGVLLAELLTGRRLFAAEADLDVLLKVRDVKLDRLDKYGADLPRRLDDIVRRVLRKDPAERPQSAAELREELADYLFSTGQRVGPGDLRGFAGLLFDASPEAAAKLLQAARRLDGERAQPAGVAPSAAPARPAVAPPGRGVPVRATPGRAAPTKGPIPEPIPNSRSGRSGALSLLEPQAAERAVDESDEDDSAERSSVRGFTPISQLDEEAEGANPTLRQSNRPVRRATTRSDVGRFVSGAPSRPPDSAGDVSVISPMRLCCDLALIGETGLVQFELGPQRKEIFLVGGAPDSVNSSDPGERFGEYLVGKQVLGANDLELALSMLPHYNGKLGDTMVALGLLRPLDVFRLLSQQVRDRVIDVFAWAEGTFAFYRGVTNRQDNFPLGLDPFEILGAGVIHLPGPLLDQRFAPLLDLRPVAARRERLAPEAFRIGPTPREVLSMLDGSRTLREWVEQYEDPAEVLTFQRTLYLLIETDLAELD